MPIPLVVPAQHQDIPTTTAEPLTSFARIARGAAPHPTMASLNLQFASAVAQLGSFLTIRGEASGEHYFAQALTLGCLRPLGADIAPWERTLMLFVLFDRRKPILPALSVIGDISVVEQPAIHFIQLLRDQSAFQPIYDSARRLDRYGAMSRARRKMEHVVLLSREIGGRSLLASATPAEEDFLRLACEV